MPFCVHCGHEVESADKFCERCGRPVILPDQGVARKTERKVQRRAELLQERHAADEYYRSVGSRHPHIWPVTGAGSAIYLLVLGVAAWFVYDFGGGVREISVNPMLRLGLAAVAAVVAWFLLTVVRYTLFPEVRPHNNPDMMGQKGDFWVFLIGIPLIVLALIGWLTR